MDGNASLSAAAPKSQQHVRLLTRIDDLSRKPPHVALILTRIKIYFLFHGSIIPKKGVNRKSKQ